MIADKATKDATDITTGTFTRFSGSAGFTTGPRALSGGPFVVEGQYAATAKTLITAYNAINNTVDVTVYETSQAIVNAPVRFTLTHKPFIAIGTDGGNYGTLVNQALFERAGITSAYYQSAPDNLIGAGACFTIATQAHSENAANVTNYKNFVTAGGNLMLQCASIGTFENAASGHFQSKRINLADAGLASYDVFGSNNNTDIDTSLTYPNPAMPFNQFIGTLSNQDGAITEFALTGGGTPTSQFINGTLIAARNTGSNSDNRAMVAAVSKVGNTGQPGGYVFTLGGHDYTRGNDAAIEKLNGQRMILNSIFVPVSRPCGTIGTPTVFGYKSVKLTTDQGYPGISPLDTLTWTIDYVNTGSAAAPNFQITDVLPTSVTFVASNVLVNATNSTGITLNGSYNGAGNNNLLAAGGTLGVNGRITITVKTQIKAGFYGTILNQPTANATGINVAGVKTDTVDNGTLGIFGGVTIPSGSVCQQQGGGCTNNFQTPGIDPTGVRLFAPTSADATIDGSVRDANGNGISRATVTVTNAATSVTKTALTNAFGFYSVDGLEIGNLYVVSVGHKRFTFEQSLVTFTLNDNVVGLTFVAVDPNASTKGAATAASTSKQR